MTVPEDDKAPATRYRQAHYGQDGRGQSLLSPAKNCMSRTVSVIGSFSHRQARHVARCTMLVARFTRCSSLAASGAGPTASQPVSHSAHKGPWTPGTKHSEDEMQLHVLHHMDDRGSHE